jgi:uncharacterized protein YjhX (UPF0386 family)
MRYCYTEAGKAELTLEMTVADFQELRDAVKVAAAADGSTYRIRRLSDDLTTAQHAVTDSMRRFAEELQRQLRDEAQ